MFQNGDSVSLTKVTKSFVKNLTSTCPTKKINGISVKTEINAGEKSFCNGESDFTHDWNIVISLYLFCGLVNKKH